MRRTTACFLLLAATTPALAQTSSAEIVFDIENDTLLPGQSTTVTMAAGWDGPWYLMCCVQTDLLISTGDAGWSDLALIQPMAGPGTSAGTLGATGVEGILAGQLNFPPGKWEPDPNPLPFWSATYTAPSDAVAPFDVALATETSLFDVYIERESHDTRSLMDVLTEGQATIHVIPAPASLLIITGGSLLAARRRQ
ncbi:MAG: hypothetical protein NCW75_01665 [Phycisphaera sp.]|nr:MAG: hypothetical protein NCW75_01665 [Phycisphaera sp.]